LRVLVFTHMYPTPGHPEHGVFVEQQVASLRREGIQVDVLHVDTKRSKWLYLWSFVPFTKQVLANRYDLIHAHYVFAGVVARSQLRCPVILTHHGAEVLWGWQAPLCRLMSRVVDRTIVMSREMNDAIGLANVVVIPCGVDLELFSPREQMECRAKLKLPPDRKLVLFVGRHAAKEKRYDLIEGAVNQLRRDAMDVELVLSYKEPYDKIPLYMNACDALVLASDFEGSPQVVKEAMACNLPVVSVDVGDVAEILDGVEGCYICRRDASSIAATLRVALEQGRRTNGRAAIRHYELGSIARRVIEVYRETLTRKEMTRS
jgi:teichuronic acid biosynthesis glycosyltransferase TuaC